MPLLDQPPAVEAGHQARPVGVAPRVQRHARPARAPPARRLAAAAEQEAQEWAGEMAEVGAAFERYGRELAAAAAEQRRLDADGVRGTWS